MGLVPAALTPLAAAGQNVQLPDAGRRLVWHPRPYAIPSDAVFVDPKGQQVRLRDAAGPGLTLVNLWATWCAPCVLELPELLKLKGLMVRDAFAVVTIALDRDAAPVEAFLRRWRSAGLDANRDPEMALYRYVGARGLPTSLLVDGRGREVARVTGPVRWTAPALVSRLRAISRQGASSS